jgi:hypothetical protein
MLRSVISDSDALTRIGFGACAAIVIGSIGPWADFGAKEVLGIDSAGSDGWLTLALAGMSAAVLWSWSQFPAREKLLGVILMGGLALALTLYDTVELSGVGTGAISAEWGLILALAASAALVAVAIRLAVLNPA